MSTTTYHKRHAYSTHPGADHEGIERGNYNEIPAVIGGVAVFDVDGCYNPTWHDCDQWLVRPSGWAVHIATGLRVRYTRDYCPNYKGGQHGTMTGTLAVDTRTLPG